MKNTVVLVILLFIAAGVASGQPAQEQPATNSATGSKSSTTTTAAKRPDLNSLLSLAGKKAPNFVSVDMNGTEYNLENLRGKIVVINLWATWCEPCIAEMPQLNELVNKYQEKGVVFLAPTMEDKALVEGFLQKTPFSYHVLPNAIQAVKQYSPKEPLNPETGKSRTIQALPTHIVIDREGLTVKHIWGFSERKVFELAETIEKLVTQR